MLMRRGFLGLAAHPGGEQAAHRGKIQDRVQRTGFGALQPAEHRVLDRVADVALLRHRVDQAERFGLARVDGLAGQHQRHRLHRIDQMREARGAAETGMQAEHHFRKAEARAVDGDARRAGQRHFEPAAETEAVDHGDGRNLQRFQPVDHRMRAADLRFHGARIGGAAEFIDVGAGNEAGWFCRADDDARRALAFQRRQHGVELFHHVG